MINNKKDLKIVLKYEKSLYLKKKLKMRIGQRLAGSYQPQIYRYIVHLRKEEYFFNAKSGFIKKIGYCYHKRAKRKIGSKLGIDIGKNAFDKGLKILHPVAIIVNGDAKIGKNCRLHGNVCIGNNGIYNDSLPTIGDNVDIGYGSIIVGKINIPNNVIIGANSFVNKSFFEENIVIAGNPAHVVKHCNTKIQN